MTTARTPSTGHGWWPLRDLPVVGWLLLLVAATLVHPALPAPRWLMIHLLLLGAVTHAIVVWSTHFTQTLLHVPGPSRRAQSLRLSVLNLGVLGVLAGVVTSRWAVVVLGATAVVVAVVGHGVALVRMLRAALPSRFAPLVRYYVAAACCLPVGAVLGTLMAREPGEAWHARLELAHVVVNVLGWMGLTVTGTLVTLWPTMLRTRMDAAAEQSARRALPVLVAGVATAAACALTGHFRGVGIGMLAYLAGLGLLAVPLVRTARRRPPSSYAAWSVLAACGWLAGGLLGLTVGALTAEGPAQAASRLGALTPLLAAGFGAQVLLGALSHLVPVALGGGPAVRRRTEAVLDAGSTLRVTGTNLGLLVCALPVPSPVRVLASVVVLGCLAAFLPLLALALRARRAEVPADRPVPARPPGQLTGLAVTGLSLVLLAVAGGVALDPTTVGARADASAGATPTGHTTVVEIEAQHLRFSPATVVVPAGDRLVLEVTNTDDHVHDLVLETGDSSGRLESGETGRIDVGVVGRDLAGWCSVVGHRQQGMTLSITTTGAPEGAAATDHDPDPMATDHTATEHAADGPPAVPDFLADPEPGFVAHDAALPPVLPGRVHRVTLTVREVEREVAPGVTQTLWTYDGTAPGPVLHGRVGDRFVVTLVNDGTIGHSVDFHAGALAPQGPMRTLDPGESLHYRFTATRAGIWMYHCSTMPMSDHIAAGMFGAVVIDPPGLPRVDRSYVLVQSELYLGPQGGEVDADEVAAEEPDAVVFNGYADQYDHQPLDARPGERVRVWVLDAGPSRATSFHVVGAQLDATYAEGAWLLRRGSPGGAQSLALQPAQGGFVELSFPEPGDYPFVSHVMVDAERGAHGLFHVTR